MIIIVTNKFDVTSDFVIAALRSRGAVPVRFNTEDFLREWHFSWTTSGAKLSSSRHSFRLDAVTAVYYRRPKTPTPGNGTARTAASFCVQEGRAALRNVLALLDCYWISPIPALERAENKLLQLRMAAALGFSVPDTICTNESSTAINFIDNTGGEKVVKPLSNGWLSDEPPTMAYTSAVDSTMRDHIEDAVTSTPHLLQRRIPKISDVRVTVVGDKVFACRIHSQCHAATALDFRAASAAKIALRHELFNLPSEVDDLCVGMLRTLGLEFGAIDLIEKADGYCFLEINPNGQWAWIQQLTGAPIADAIADLLLSGSVTT